MLNKLRTFFTKPNFGLLVIRVVIGAMFIQHGVTKFLAGKPTLEALGKSMAIFGVGAYPIFWGFLAALAESLGGLLMVLGYHFRVAMFFLTCTMIVATISMYQSTHDILHYGWSLEIGAVFLGLLFVGPGRFSIDKS